MKQSVPKATVPAGGRHAWSRTLILYAIFPNFYKSSLRFKDEKGSLKKVSESHTTRLTAEGFESWTNQYLLPFRNSNKFIRI